MRFHSEPVTENSRNGGAEQWEALHCPGKFKRLHCTVIFNGGGEEVIGKKVQNRI